MIGTRELQFKNLDGNLTQIGSERSGLANSSLKMPIEIFLKSVQNGRESGIPVQHKLFLENLIFF